MLYSSIFYQLSIKTGGLQVTTKTNEQKICYYKASKEVIKSEEWADETVFCFKK